MSYYKLVASGRPDVVVDEIILERDETTGEVSKAVSTTSASELSGDELQQAKGLARLLGYQIVEADEPKEQVQEQPTGADVAGQSPVIQQTGPSSSTVDQQAEEKIVEEADSEGSSGGVGGSAGSTPAAGGTSVSGGTPPSGTPSPNPSTSSL